MKPKATIQWTLAFLLLASCMQAQSIWNTAHLANVKHSIHEPFYATTYEILKAEADRLLDAQPLSVMMKEKTPASGDKHDYMSQARYYWPDPTKPNGLPYINRDGVSNPELNKLDRNRLGTTAGRITTLALVWYFSGEEQYARKATELIRVWFLNKDTRMNPNLEYAQMMPGHNNDKGRCYADRHLLLHRNAGCCGTARTVKSIYYPGQQTTEEMVFQTDRLDARQSAR